MLEKKEVFQKVQNAGVNYVSYQLKIVTFNNKK